MAMNPIKRFCKVIERLPEKHQRSVIPYCHFAIGPGTTAELVQPSVERLRERLKQVVGMGISEEFLIPGLFLYVVELLRRRSAFDGRAETIKVRGEVIERMRAMLLIPVEEREPRTSDEQLHDFIQREEESLAGFGKQQAEENELVGVLEHEQLEQFTGEYWQKWRTSKIG